jgi:predicted nucleotidyltransferase component of viral defense system
MKKEIKTFSSPDQIKAWIKNTAKQKNVPTNVILQNFMMERYLERVAASPYKDNFILKGGFLIASMIGIDLRSTMDMDTTIQGLPVTLATVKNIITEIGNITLPDKVSFKLQTIKPIHEVGKYEDFRVVLKASMMSIEVNLKIDITTGDVILPGAINYTFPLMFENRSIDVKAYNINNILAEKIESILSRNISNTRARDYYDVYTLVSVRKMKLIKQDFLIALKAKAKERGTLIYLENYRKYLADIKASQDLANVWQAYARQYSYAAGILFSDIVVCLENTLIMLDED